MFRYKVKCQFSPLLVLMPVMISWVSPCDASPDRCWPYKPVVRSCTTRLWLRSMHLGRKTELSLRDHHCQIRNAVRRRDIYEITCMRSIVDGKTGWLSGTRFSLDAVIPSCRPSKQEKSLLSSHYPRRCNTQLQARENGPTKYVKYSITCRVAEEYLTSNVS